MRSSSGSSGDRAGAAGTGFTDPSFVDAHGDVPIAKVAYVEIAERSDRPFGFTTR